MLGAHCNHAHTHTRARARPACSSDITAIVPIYEWLIHLARLKPVLAIIMAVLGIRGFTVA